VITIGMALAVATLETIDTSLESKEGIMKKQIARLSLVLLLIMGFAATASAIPITGAVSFAGGGGTNSDLDLTLATQFLSFTSVAVVAKSGSYAPITIPPTSVVINPFTFSPFPALGVTPLWTISSGGINYSLDATSLMFLNSSTHFLNVRGTGIAHIDGFDDTLSTWSITATHEGQYAFGSSAEAVVPEPLTLILLGSGLLGLAGLRRKLGK
jgi:hypothetical protein